MVAAIPTPIAAAARIIPICCCALSILHDGAFRTNARARTTMNRHLHDLRHVQRGAIGLLLDLLLATESVGDDQLVVLRLPHFRQQQRSPAATPTS